jgi:tetrahydromethanopterin S-methyltransferase subunit B
MACMLALTLRQAHAFGAGHLAEFMYGFVVGLSICLSAYTLASGRRCP